MIVVVQGKQALCSSRHCATWQASHEHLYKLQRQTSPPGPKLAEVRKPNPNQVFFFFVCVCVCFLVFVSVIASLWCWWWPKLGRRLLFALLRSLLPLLCGVSFSFRGGACGCKSPSCSTFFLNGSLHPPSTRNPWLAKL